MKTAWLGAGLVAVLAMGCGGGDGTSAEEGDAGVALTPDAAVVTEDAGSTAADAAVAAQDAGGTGGDAGVVTADGGGDFTLVITATTETFPHADGYAGQTARQTSGGVRSLQLLRQEGDPAPVELFNLGAHPAAVGYNHGDRTEVARVATETLVAGHFTLARMVQAYSRYTVDASQHVLGVRTDGSYTCLLVMSDGTEVDGTTLDSGAYDFTFTPNEGEAQHYAGVGWPVPVWSATAGAWAVLEAGEWAVYFPVDLSVDPAAWRGATVTVQVNMDHAFRWVDNPLGYGYRADVWDVEWPAPETVMRFGGNRFDVSVALP